MQFSCYQQLRDDRNDAVPKDFINPFQLFNAIIDENMIPAPCLDIIIRRDKTKRDLAGFFARYLLLVSLGHFHKRYKER